MWCDNAHSLVNSVFCTTNIIQIVDFTAWKEKNIYQHIVITGKKPCNVGEMQ